jgi:hypothetical protein
MAGWYVTVIDSESSAEDKKVECFHDPVSARGNTKRAAPLHKMMEKEKENGGFWRNHGGIHWQRKRRLYDVHEPENAPQSSQSLHQQRRTTLGYKMDRGLRIFSHALTDVSRSSLHDPPIPTTNSRYLSSSSSSKGMQLHHPTGCTLTTKLSLDGRASKTGMENGSITYDLYVIDPSSLPSCGRTRRNLFDLKKYLQGFHPRSDRESRSTFDTKLTLGYIDVPPFSVWRSMHWIMLRRGPEPRKVE